MSEVSLKEMQAQLLAEVSMSMPQHGFDSKVVGQGFYRSTSFGRAGFHLSFVRHPPTDFDVLASVSVRVDAVEDLVNESEPMLSKAEKKRTATIGAELGNLAGSGQLRWTVTEPQDIPRVAADVLGVFESIGLPYIDRFNSLDRIFEVLSREDGEAWLYSPILSSRCKRAVALAAILDRRSELNQLVSRCERRLQEKDDLSIKTFHELVGRVRRLLCTNELG